MRLSLVSTAGSVSFQGGPRTGARHFGVPAGGPFDTVASRTANALLDNGVWDTVVELAMSASVFTVTESGWVSVSGGGHRVSLEGVDVAMQSRFFLGVGQRLETAPVVTGLRAYLAACGGFRGAAAGFGPGDRWESENDRTFDRALRTEAALGPCNPQPIRYMALVDSMIGAATVTNRIDRVGLRLQPDVRKQTEGSALSRPTVAGCVQRTPDGELLVHGPDGPTIGGYETVGVVCRADSCRLAQLRPGDRVEFVAVSSEESVNLLRAQEEGLERLFAELRARGPRGT